MRPMGETPPGSPPDEPTGGAAPPGVPPQDGGVAGWADLPRPIVRPPRRFNISLVWLVPIVALIVGASLLIREALLVGPQIQIQFASAEGVQAGNTEVRYKDVVIGHVEGVSLAEDHERVVVTVRLDHSAADFAVEDTSFWVVRARIGLGGVTGLGTLLSGSYIGADAGVSKQPRSHFVGLEAPPLVLHGEPGSIFVLQAADLGSLDVGSPVFYRRTRVGRVVGYTLDPVQDQLSVKIFVDAPYQTLVTPRSRFWNASGVDLTLNASGLTISTQTITSVLIGGIAFENPPDGARPEPAPAGSMFTLYGDRASALSPLDGPPLAVTMSFDESVRGLVEGSPIDFLGINIGRVNSISVRYDETHQRFPVRVSASIYPRRLGPVQRALVPGQPNAENDAAMVRLLIDKGLRAQLRTGNLLTGQLYVALDFDAKPGAVKSRGKDGETLTVPTIPGTLSQLQPQLAEIVGKINKFPIEALGAGLLETVRGANAAIAQLSPTAQKALAEVQRTLQQAQKSLENLDRNVASPDAPLQRGVDETLEELRRTARSLRVLSDYLQLHPEALLRGKPADRPLPEGRPR
jgi:paraquat-inducible protein B